MQAIALTTAALQGHERQGSAAAASTSAALVEGGVAGKKRKSRFDTAGSGAAGALPTQVLSQIRSAKARSALEGHAPMGWAIGFPCLARDASGHWAAAQVSAVTADGSFTVAWDGGDGGSVTVHKADCRPRDTGVRLTTPILFVRARVRPHQGLSSCLAPSAACRNHSDARKDPPAASLMCATQTQQCGVTCRATRV